MNDFLPPYARDATFRMLLRLCEGSGMRVEFADIPEGIYARSRDMLIQMPLESRFSGPEHAAIVLGHELAHSLVNERYAVPNDDDLQGMAQYMLVESECDRLGAYFYLLARRMMFKEANDTLSN